MIDYNWGVVVQYIYWEGMIEKSGNYLTDPRITLTDFDHLSHVHMYKHLTKLIRMAWNDTVLFKRNGTVSV